jgi:hypothetical protein
VGGQGWKKGGSSRLLEHASPPPEPFKVLTPEAVNTGGIGCVKEVEIALFESMDTSLEMAA